MILSVHKLGQAPDSRVASDHNIRELAKLYYSLYIPVDAIIQFNYLVH
jgi:hypothetical protein